MEDKIKLRLESIEYELDSNMYNSNKEKAVIQQKYETRDEMLKAERYFLKNLLSEIPQAE